MNFSRLVGGTALLLLVAGFFLYLPAGRAQTGEAPAKPPGKPNAKAWKADREAAQKARAQGRMQEASSFFQAALNEAENFGPKDYRLAESLSDLGNFEASLGNFPAAEPLLRRAVAIRRGDPNRLLEAQCLADLGFACLNLREYADAEKSLLQARELVDRAVGPDHPLDVVCRLYLAQLYLVQKEYDQAEPLFTQAVELFLHPVSKVKFEQRMDPALYAAQAVRYTYRPDYALARVALNGLAELYTKEGRYDKAGAAWKQVVQAAEEQPGAPASELQMALGNLANFFVSQTNYPEAEGVLVRLEKSEEKSPGLNNPATIKTLHLLARVYDFEEKTAEAESAYKQIVEVEEKSASSDGVELTTASGNLAGFYKRRGHYEQAAAVYERLWDHMAKARSNDIRELPMLAQLAEIYARLGRDDGLEKVYREQIATYEKTFGPNHKALLKPLADYAQLLRKLKRDAEAESLETRADAIKAAQGGK